MRAHRVFKQRPQLLRRGTKITRFACVARSRRKRRVPPGPRAWRAPALRNVEEHSMARRQGKHSFEERDRLGHAAKKQVGSESILRNALGRGAAGEKCANLRSKRKAVRGLRVIKRLDAQRVARQEKNWRGGASRRSSRARAIPLRRCVRRRRRRICRTRYSLISGVETNALPARNAFLRNWNRGILRRLSAYQASVARNIRKNNAAAALSTRYKKDSRY